MKIVNQARSIFLSQFLLILTLGFFSASVASADTIASFRIVTGGVDLMKGGKLPAVPAKVDISLTKGDFVRTRSGGYAEVVYKDGTVLKIAQRSRIDIGEQVGTDKKNSPNAKLVRGMVQAVVTPAAVIKGGASAGGKHFEIHTPNAVAGVRGTDFIVTYQRNVTGVLVLKGSVYTYNPLIPDRVVNLTPSTLTSITAGAAPLPARAAGKSEIERIERDIAPQTEPSGSSSSSEVVPTDIPASSLIPGDSSDLMRSKPASVPVSPLSPPPPPPLKNTNVNVDIIFVPSNPPPPPLPVNTNVNIDIIFAPPSPPPLPANSNVNVDVIFAPSPPPPLPTSTNVNVDIKF